MTNRQNTPGRVKDADLKKFSTQLFDYQIETLRQLSQRRGNPTTVLSRFAFDLFIVAYRDYLRKYNISVPKELTTITLEEFVRSGIDFPVPSPTQHDSKDSVNHK